MEISSQSQLRNQGQPAFCYLCGNELAPLELVNRDHCPPKNFFARPDRNNFPIILPTHEACNHQWHEVDDLIGILADALHTRKKSQDTNVTKRLEAYALSFNGKNTPAVRNVPLTAMAFRIVRGMHALLYKSFLPLQVRHGTHIPLPTANLETEEVERPLKQAFTFSNTIHRALLTNTADQINAYNRKFRYACVWDHLNNSTPFCIFAFDIYGFHHLSPAVQNFPKCFVGYYIPASVPTNASWVSNIEFNLSQREVLDPWQRT